MRLSHVRTAHGFLLCFCVQDANFAQQVESQVEQILQERDTDFVPLVLVGTCSDLPNHAANKDQALQQLVSTYHVQYVETSSKNNVHVADAFTALANDIVTLRNKQPSNHTSTQSQEKKPCMLQ